MLTVFLPRRVLSLYMNVCTNFYRHITKRFNASWCPPRCRHRDFDGVLTCSRDVLPTSPFCRHHQDEHRLKAAHDWPGSLVAPRGCVGVLVIVCNSSVVSTFRWSCSEVYLRKHDMIEVSSEGDGWVYGQNTRTLQSGWMPSSVARREY